MAINKLKSIFTDIADSIREKTGSSDSIIADKFPFELVSIPDNTVFLSIINRTVIDIPESYLTHLTSIGDRSFMYCTNLALTSLPESITTIGYSAFYCCTSLTTLTFKGTPTTIRYNAFQYCHKLKTINVPWAEGAVAGAPWGATNATINYNYNDN